MRAVIFAVVVAGVMTAVCVAADWPYVRRSFERWRHPGRRAAGSGRPEGPVTAPGRTPPARHRPRALADPRSPEGILTRRLIAKEISATEYRRLMADLAARDDRHHRLEVPRDPGHPPRP